jgi:hypothetical protein
LDGTLIGSGSGQRKFLKQGRRKMTRKYANRFAIRENDVFVCCIGDAVLGGGQTEDEAKESAEIEIKKNHLPTDIDDCRIEKIDE